MNKMLTKVTVNSVDVSSYKFKWETVERFGDVVHEIYLEFITSVYDVVAMRPGLPLVVQRGFVTSTDKYVFQGYIDRIDKAGSKILVYGRDKMVDLINKSVTYSYDGANNPLEAKGSDIAKDLIETWGGMIASVVDTGSALTLKKFICRGTDILGRLKVLCDIYDYQVYFDPEDGMVHFEPLGYVDASTVMYVGGGSTNISNIPTWSFDNTQCVNKLIVKGALQEVTDDQYFNGNGAGSQSFTLAKKPVIVQVWEYVGAAWVLKVPGVPSSTSGTYDYEIDKENKKINCTSSWSPASGSNNVWVRYTNAIPVPIQVEDVSSQALYGVIQAEKMFSDIQSVDDAEQRGRGWVNKYSSPFVRTMVKPATLIDYDVGKRVRVVDAINGEDRWVVVNEIKKKYPHDGDEINVGDVYWRLAEWGNFTLERIRRLEEENQKDAELLVQIVQLPQTINPSLDKLKITRYRVETAGFLLSGDGCILPYYLDSPGFGNPFGAEQTVFTWTSTGMMSDSLLTDENLDPMSTCLWSSGKLTF